jgi:predicted O-linked N-acetylglucosamine transferase (SPINDLY family)
LEWNAAVRRNLVKEAVKRGIAADRIKFAPLMKLEDHLARLRLADVFLDTLPHNAHTTASDALWCGVPVLTCLGSTFAGRVAASLLQAVGLDELITHSLETYETLALKLARGPAQLAALKARLAKNRNACALFDTPRYTRNLETAYRTMWERQQRGEPPASLSVGVGGDGQ